MEEDFSSKVEESSVESGKEDEVEENSTECEVGSDMGRDVNSHAYSQCRQEQNEELVVDQVECWLGLEQEQVEDIRLGLVQELEEVV